MNYFDWTATTRPSARVIEIVNKTMTEEWGNPSSFHHAGVGAERMLTKARSEVARALGFGRPVRGEVIFTSGGTEANNLFLLGAAHAKSRRGRILITSGEHASVENSAAALEREGFEVVRIPTLGGVLDIDKVRAASDGVIAASFMLVNNEHGAIYDVRAAAAAVREKSPAAVIHTDAVQAFMKVKFTPERLGVNAVSISAHKIGALKGTGALWIDERMVKEKWICPQIYGGGQEKGYRSGTENVPGICALGAAAAESLECFDERMTAVAGLRALLEERLADSGLVLNLPPQGAAFPGILSVTAPGVKSETLLNEMSGRGFCISSGSACSSHGKKASLALASFGLDAAAADSTVRISIGYANTEDEVCALAANLADAAASLRRK